MWVPYFPAGFENDTRVIFAFTPILGVSPLAARIQTPLDWKPNPAALQAVVDGVVYPCSLVETLENAPGDTYIQATFPGLTNVVGNITLLSLDPSWALPGGYACSGGYVDYRPEEV